MLSISEFSEMCHLPPQTLRFYHAEGLLVPAGVDERTGYRSYAFEQVEQAMLITALRDTGMSVKLVRQALDEPDRVVALLDRHHEEVSRQRVAQDEAIQAARAVFDAQPEPQSRHVPATTVVTTVVHGTPLGRNTREWERSEAIIEAATADLVRTVRGAGITPTGTPWRSLTPNSSDPDRRPMDGEGPAWTVSVPVAASADALAALPGDLLVRQHDARDELSIFIPGRHTMAKHSTVLLRLLNACPPDGDRFVNLTRLRQENHDDGVRHSAPLER